MPGTFAYDEATNTIDVTDGTEGAEATYHDMYLADQAGTGTILNVAENGAANVTLDYAIRPTHDKALKVKCIVAAKTAEADFIFITGTDAWGAAQTEALDVTAGNGSYETTKRFATITNLDCSDNAAGGGAVWDDGTIAVTQDIWGVVWEYVTDAQYKIDCNVNFGDGVTATYFQSKNEFVYFSDNLIFNPHTSTTLEIGDLTGDWAVDGSCWSFHISVNTTLVESSQAAVVKIYGSRLHCRDTGSHYLYIYDGSWDVRNSIISGTGTTGFRPYWTAAVDDLKLRDVIFSNIFGINSQESPSVANNIHIHNSSTALSIINVDVSMTDVLVTNYATNEFYVSGGQKLSLIDPRFHPSAISLVDANILIEQYTCNIHIADEDGADLESVSIACATFGNVVSNDAGSTFYKCIEDHTSGVFADDLAAGKWELTTAAYAALAGCTGMLPSNGAWVTGIDYKASETEFTGITTDSDGDIAEQNIDYKKWVGTSKALLTYSPHTFSLTHASYPDFTINDVKVDHPIVWRHEMGISNANLMTLIDSAVFAKKGITQGGNWDFTKVVKILAAWTMGLARDKSGEAGVVEILDPDDEATVIAELSRSDDSPYKTVTVKI